MNERRGFNEKDYGLSSYLAENMFSHFLFLTLFCVLADLHVIRWDFLVNYVIKLFWNDIWNDKKTSILFRRFEWN